jgi:ABC-type hemin transport system ATPase subunit/GNAT superfamily N-acetyltransferase
MLGNRKTRTRPDDDRCRSKSRSAEPNPAAAWQPDRPDSVADPAAEIRISVRHDPRRRSISSRAAGAVAAFGLAPETEARCVIDGLRLPVGPGRIVLLLGPSGSGKTSILEAVARQIPAARCVQRTRFCDDAAIIDDIAPHDDPAKAAGILAASGLGEPRLWLRSLEELSEGERVRARLARTLSLTMEPASPAPLLCDEFCASLHARDAKAVSCNLRKLASRHGLCVIAACSRTDLIADLQPDVTIELSGAGRFVVKNHPAPANRPVSLLRRLIIEPGKVRDYEAFAAMHYRPGDELGFVDRVFVLRDRVENDPVGVIVYGHAPLSLRLRNEATGGRFLRRPDRLRRELRILRRLVIHPDVRGCGLGRHLVRRTLPLLNTEYVECLSTLGETNPVFERAGMIRVGRYECPVSATAAATQLRAMNIDPAAHDFAWQVARHRNVRAIVMGVVADWYAGTTGGGVARVTRQPAAFLARTFRSLISLRPVYYLWQNKRRNDGVPSRRRKKVRKRKTAAC